MKKLEQKQSMYALGTGEVTLGLGTLASTSIGLLTVQGTKNRKTIGTNVKEKDIDKKSPKTSLFFMTPESIDNLVKTLGRIKRMMASNKRIQDEKMKKMLGGATVSLAAPKKKAAKRKKK